MNIKKTLFPTLLFCTMLTLLLRGFIKPVSAEPAASTTSYDAIDTYIEQQMRRFNLPGVSLAIVEGDQIIHMRGFGQARPGGQAPSPQTTFIIGSTNKSFTALAVMQLVEAGKIELDAPVQHYLPWFRVADPQASGQMTVRHLLNQSSSLPLNPAWQQLADFDSSPDATERQARALSTLQLTRPVGSAFEYSNVNYNILGLIIEAASGETYTDYIQHHIFDPLEMKHSYTSKPAADQEDMAVGHQTWFGIPIAVPDLPIPLGSQPSGQLVSNAEDMGRYLIAHLNQGSYAGKKVISPEGMAELHRPAVPAISAGVDMGHYGMGWYITEHDQTQIINHTGMVPDYYTYMALLPEQKKGMILLVNANYFTHEINLTEVGEGIAMLVAGKQPAPIQFGFIPWAIRSLLLIPLIQIAGVLATLRRVGRWRCDPQRIPSRGKLWGLHLLLPAFFNLILTASGVAILTSNVRGFLLLFMPDLSWLAILSGGFALVWTFLRTKIILRMVQKPGSVQQGIA